MKIIFWSQSGNTEKMAQLIKKGIELEGKNAEVLNVSSVGVDDIKEEEVLIMGCPACGAEGLEEDEMEPFVESLQGHINGKKVALFGSYGWGGGEWMTEWEERIKAYGGDLIKEGLIVNETPEDDDNECIDFGRFVSKQ